MISRLHGRAAIAALLALALLAIGQGSARAATSPVCAPPSCTFPAAPTALTFKRAKKSRASRKTGRVTVKVAKLPRGFKATIQLVGKHTHRKLRVGSKSKKLSLRPGTWTISASPVLANGAYFYPPARVYKVKLKGGGAGTVNFDYSSAYNAALRYAKGSAIKQLVGPDAAGVYTLTLDDPGHIVKAGNIFVAGIGPNSPRGILLRVKDAKASGKQTVAHAVQGQLNDLGDVSFTTSKDVPLPKDYVTSKSPRLKTLAASLPTRPSVLPQYIDPFWGCRAGTGGHSSEIGFGFDGPDLHFSTSFVHGIFPAVEASLSARFTSHMDIVMGSGYECKFDHRMGGVYLAYIQIPGLPVVITPYMQLAFTGSADLSAGLEFSATAALYADAGFKLSPAGFEPTGDAQESDSHTGPTLAGQGHLKITLGPVITIQADAIKTSDINLDAFIEATWESGDAKHIAIDEGLEAGATISLAGLADIAGDTNILEKRWPIYREDRDLIDGGPHDYSNRVALGFQLGEAFQLNSYTVADAPRLEEASCAQNYCVFSNGSLGDDGAIWVYDAGTWSGPYSTAGEGGVGWIDCVAAYSCYGITGLSVLKHFDGATWSTVAIDTATIPHDISTGLSCTSSMCASWGPTGRFNVLFGPNDAKHFYPGITISNVSCAEVDWCLIAGTKVVNSQGVAGYWTYQGGELSAFHPTTELDELYLTRFSCADSTTCYGFGDGKLHKWDLATMTWDAGEVIGNGYTVQDVDCLTDGSKVCAVANTGGVAYIRHAGAWLPSNQLSVDGDSILKISCGTANFCAALEGPKHVDPPPGDGPGGGGDS